LEAAADGTVYVADTNNHLVRVVNATRWVFTLAGHVKALQVSGCCWRFLALMVGGGCCWLVVGG
jgi:hypothetical protein